MTSTVLTRIKRHQTAICYMAGSHLISIPPQLPDVLQELVCVHVGGVQTGLMLAGHLGGSRGSLLTPSIICMDSAT